MATLEELRNWGHHKRALGGPWQVTANVFGGTVNVMRGLGCGSVSRHWDRFWSGLQDEVLGAQKSEAQQKPWRVPLACKQLLFPSIFFLCYLHSNQGPQSPTRWQATL